MNTHPAVITSNPVSPTATAPPLLGRLRSAARGGVEIPRGDFELPDSADHAAHRFEAYRPTRAFRERPER